jgi:hypothetical protein
MSTKKFFLITAQRFLEFSSSCSTIVPSQRQPGARRLINDSIVASFKKHWKKLKSNDQWLSLKIIFFERATQIISKFSNSITSEFRDEHFDDNGGIFVDRLGSKSEDTSRDRLGSISPLRPIPILTSK